MGELAERPCEDQCSPAALSTANLALTMFPLDRARMYLEDMVAVLNAAGEH